VRRRVLAWAVAVVVATIGSATAEPESAATTRPQATSTPVRTASGNRSAARVGNATTPATWRIQSTSWSDRDEQRFAEFVARIGDSGCRTVHACLTSPAANPQFAASNPPGMSFYADCADLPYVLRAYFAWKSGLPFSFASGVLPLGSSTDIRYTARGNQITNRVDIPAGADARKVLPTMSGLISSAFYRVPPGHVGRLGPDHYPIKITRESIRPGTIIYDPNGHVAVVYKVSPEGRIHFIDSHPDNSLTRGVYGKSFVRASPAMSAGFKRWRPLRLEGAAQRADGSYEGGRIVLAGDRDIADWSDEQFYGTTARNPASWSAGRFEIGGERADWYDFVRRRLAHANFRYDPIEETRSLVRGLCEDLRYRTEAVDAAIKAGMASRPQPDRLPINIYGTDGDWETYSTPSRDARLKTAFRELRDEIVRFLTLSRTESHKLAYAGERLAHDIAAVYLAETRACRISYVRSNGTTQEIAFRDAETRLYALSFDPYHCVERRWGATAAEELATCPDGAEKRAWYDAEQRLRNQPDRTYDVRMGFSLGELKQRAPGSGLDASPDVSVAAVLAAEGVSLESLASPEPMPVPEPMPAPPPAAAPAATLVVGVRHLSLDDQ